MKEFWLHMSESELAAAKSLQREFPRASVSRAYYAAFAATHAILLHKNLSPRPGMGTWKHDGLWDVLRSALVESSPSRAPAATFKQYLKGCYEARLQADYNPAGTVDEQTSRDVTRDAGRVVALAKGILT